MGTIYKISLVCAAAAGILFSPTEAVSLTRSTVVKDRSGSLQDRPAAFKANDNSNSDIVNGNYPFAIPVQLEDESDEYFDPFMEPFNDGRFESPDRFMPAGSSIRFENPINIDVYNGPTEESSIEYGSSEESRIVESYIEESHIEESPIEDSRIEESHIEETYIEQPCVGPPCNGESLGEDVSAEVETIEAADEAEIEEEEIAPLEEGLGNIEISVEDETEDFEAEPTEELSNDDELSDSVEFSPILKNSPTSKKSPLILPKNSSRHTIMLLSRPLLSDLNLKLPSLSERSAGLVSSSPRLQITGLLKPTSGLESSPWQVRKTLPSKTLDFSTLLPRNTLGVRASTAGIKANFPSYL